MFLGDLSKQTSPYQSSAMFPSTLFSRSFIVLHFTFMSVIHFELIFVKGVSSVSRFAFMLRDDQLV